MGLYVLEKQNMRFGLMHFIMLPAQTLVNGYVSRYSNVLCSLVAGLTCVIPSPRHSSSHSSFNVPFDGSK